MRNKKSNPVAIIIFCLYFVTIFVYGFSLFNHYNKGPERVQQTEKEIIKAINSCMKYTEPGTQEFAQKLSSCEELQKYMTNSSDLYAITLSYNNELIFAFPSDLNEQTFSITSPLIVPKHDTLYTQKGNPLKYTAAYYYLSPNIIFSNGRVAFFVLLVLTFIAAISLILAYAKDPHEEYDYNGDFETEDFVENTKNKTIDIQTQVNQNQDLENDTQVIMKYKDKRPNRDELFTSLEKEDFNTNNLPDEKTSTTILFQEENNFTSSEEENILYGNENTLISESQQEEDEEASAEEKNDIIFLTPENATLPGEDDSVYSAITGFGKEQYMLSQLNSELVEVTAQEEDLTIFIIRIPGLSRDCEASQKICEFLKQLDGAQDFIFEYRNDGYTLIMPTIDINYALTLSDGFHKGIVEILNSFQHEPYCFIGISSKSVRIITGERLVKEAEQALIHAQEEENSPIIAFRVDPEKYRNYIAQEAKKVQEV